MFHCYAAPSIRRKCHESAMGIVMGRCLFQLPLQYGE
jgi:hypothetical protein